MKVDLVATGSAILLAVAGVKGDLCAGAGREIEGNWYCQPVKAIQYTNVGASGTYKQITHMGSDGSCSSTVKQFSGPLSPLNEEVSLHFRGPLHLKQLAAYAPSKAHNHKRHAPELEGRSGAHQHNHQHLHKHRAKEMRRNEEKRQMISATIDGKVVSWQNNWFGDKTANAPAASPSSTWVTATIDGQVVSWVNNWFGPSSTAAPQAPSSALNSIQSTIVPVASPTTAISAAASQEQHPHDNAYTKIPTPSSATGGSGTFERIGYYNSGNQTLDNLVFLSNHGGQGSGVFDLKFGASLSYTNCDGTAGAASPQILADKAIPSDAEVVVMLSQECKDGSCGFIRPGTVAHHGFDGADKVFLFEFSMPMDGTSGFNADMPAIWMLNAQIPRTLQYGNADCSCWTSGCGEFDIVEALHSGSTFLKSTLHANQKAGDSDYIARPMSDSMKLAVVFNAAASSIHLQVLPDHTDFSQQISAGDVAKMCTETPEKGVSRFHVS